jgi:hypothetical protein
MLGVACGSDTRLRQDNFNVLNRHHTDRVAIGGSLSELNCGNFANDNRTATAVLRMLRSRSSSSLRASRPIFVSG